MACSHEYVDVKPFEACLALAPCSLCKHAHAGGGAPLDAPAPAISALAVHAHCKAPNHPPGQPRACTIASASAGESSGPQGASTPQRRSRRISKSTRTDGKSRNDQRALVQKYLSQLDAPNDLSSILITFDMPRPQGSQHLVQAHAAEPQPRMPRLEHLPMPPPKPTPPTPQAEAPEARTRSSMAGASRRSGHADQQTAASSAQHAAAAGDAPSKKSGKANEQPRSRRKLWVENNPEDEDVRGEKGSPEGKDAGAIEASSRQGRLSDRKAATSQTVVAEASQKAEAETPEETDQERAEPNQQLSGGSGSRLRIGSSSIGSSSRGSSMAAEVLKRRVAAATAAAAAGAAAAAEEAGQRERAAVESVQPVRVPWRAMPPLRLHHPYYDGERRERADAGAWQQQWQQQEQGSQNSQHVVQVAASHAVAAPASAAIGNVPTAPVASAASQPGNQTGAVPAPVNGEVDAAPPLAARALSIALNGVDAAAADAEFLTRLEEAALVLPDTGARQALQVRRVLIMNPDISCCMSVCVRNDG